MAESQNSLSILKQKSFIGGVPTDNIIEVLDEDEDMIERRLNEINEDKEPERDMINLDTDEEEVEMEGDHGSRLDNDHYGLGPMGYDEEEDDDMQDDDDDDMMGNGIVNTTDPQILKL